MTADNLADYLGVPRYRSSRQEERNEIGIATGLAWTEVGGEILPIEVTLMPGKGALTLTGKLGDVMQESAHAAMSFVRSRAEELRHRQGLQPPARRAHPRARGRHPQGRALRRHHHVPPPSSPPSPRSPVRRDVAMTGEITLRGQGAAHRRGEGEAAGRPPHRRHHDHPPPGEREGPGGRTQERARGPDAWSWSEHIDEVLKIALVPPAGARTAGSRRSRRRRAWERCPDGMTH